MTDRALFFDEQDVLPIDTDYMESERVAEHERRAVEMSSFFGVVSGFALSNPSPYTVRTGAGVGWDDLGRPLRIVTGGSEPLRAEPQDIVIAGGDVGKLVTLAYATQDQTQVDHPRTGAPNNTRRASYPTVQLRDGVPGANEIVLGAIASIDGSGNITFDLTSRTYWGPKLHPDQLADLTEAVEGIRAHQQNDHVSGIEKVGSGGDPGALTINGAVTPNEIVVNGLVVDDSLLSNGRRLSGAGALGGLTVTFDDDTTVEPQLWGIFIDGVERTCYKLAAAHYDAAPNIPGMQLVDIMPFGIVYPDPLVIDHWESGGTHRFRLGGSTNDIAVTADGSYLLRRLDDPDIAVRIHVTVASLPAGGTSGAPHTDTIEIFNSDFDDIDGSDLLLGFVWWDGTATGKLGYGTWGSSGDAYDKRRYGNLSDGQISTEFEQRLVNMIGETRVNGFVTEPTLVLGTNAVIVAMGGAPLVVGDDLSAKPYAYIDGKRLRVYHSQTLSSLVNSTDYVIYLQDDGDGTASWGFQAGTGQIGVELVAGRMPVWNVSVSSGGVVTLVDDLSVVLPHIDREAARLDRKNIGDLEITGTYTGFGLITAEAFASVTGYAGGSTVSLYFGPTSFVATRYPRFQKGKLIGIRAFTSAGTLAEAINIVVTKYEGGYGGTPVAMGAAVLLAGSGGLQVNGLITAPDYDAGDAIGVAADGSSLGGPTVEIAVVLVFQNRV